MGASSNTLLASGTRGSCCCSGVATPAAPAAAPLAAAAAASEGDADGAPAPWKVNARWRSEGRLPHRASRNASSAGCSLRGSTSGAPLSASQSEPSSGNAARLQEEGGRAGQTGRGAGTRWCWAAVQRRSGCRRQRLMALQACMLGPPCRTASAAPPLPPGRLQGLDSPQRAAAAPHRPRRRPPAPPAHPVAHRAHRPAGRKSQWEGQHRQRRSRRQGGKRAPQAAAAAGGCCCWGAAADRLRTPARSLTSKPSRMECAVSSSVFRRALCCSASPWPSASLSRLAHSRLTSREWLQSAACSCSVALPAACIPVGASTPSPTAQKVIADAMKAAGCAMRNLVSAWAPPTAARLQGRGTRENCM